MKRNLIAALFAVSAATVLAGNGQYTNDAGQQDQHAPIGFSDQYRNDAGEQDVHQSVAVNDEYRNEAGSNDEHGIKVG